MVYSLFILFHSFLRPLRHTHFLFQRVHGRFEEVIHDPQESTWAIRRHCRTNGLDSDTDAFNHDAVFDKVVHFDVNGEEKITRSVLQRTIYPVSDADAITASCFIFGSKRRRILALDFLKKMHPKSR